mmetsp:Transcript_9693/g.22788  ORF Transcript_9693/g.22788 Transcript_9693/m.22788 type:complete len:131 (+) Transcript_9693:376-768(+)
MGRQTLEKPVSLDILRHEKPEQQSLSMSHSPMFRLQNGLLLLLLLPVGKGFLPKMSSLVGLGVAMKLVGLGEGRGVGNLVGGGVGVDVGPGLGGSVGGRDGGGVGDGVGKRVGGGVGGKVGRPVGLSVGL